MNRICRFMVSILFLSMLSPVVQAVDKKPVPPAELVKNFYPPKDDYDKSYPRLFLDRKDRERIFASRFPKIERIKIKIDKDKTVKGKKSLIRHVCPNIVIDLKTGYKICIE